MIKIKLAKIPVKYELFLMITGKWTLKNWKKATNYWEKYTYNTAGLGKFDSYFGINLLSTHSVR